MSVESPPFTTNTLLLPGRLAEVMLRDGVLTGRSTLAKRHPDLFPTEAAAHRELRELCADRLYIDLYREVAQSFSETDAAGSYRETAQSFSDTLSLEPGFTKDAPAAPPADGEAGHSADSTLVFVRYRVGVNAMGLRQAVCYRADAPDIAERLAEVHGGAVTLADAPAATGCPPKSKPATSQPPATASAPAPATAGCAPSTNPPAGSGGLAADWRNSPSSGFQTASSLPDALLSLLAAHPNGIATRFILKQLDWTAAQFAAAKADLLPTGRMKHVAGKGWILGGAA